MMPKWWIKQGQPLEIFEQSYLSRIHKLFGSIKRKLEKSEITPSEMFTGRGPAANWQTNGWRLLQPLVSVHSLPVPLLFLSRYLRLGEMLPLHFSVKFHWCFFFSPEFRYCSLGKIKGVSWNLQKLVSHSCSAQQGCTNRCSLAAGLRGNEERMRKWRGNGEEMEREWGNGGRMRKSTENEEMERGWGNQQRMRKWKEDEEIGRGMRKWTENEEMERDFLSIKQFPLFALKLLYYVLHWNM